MTKSIWIVFLLVLITSLYYLWESIDQLDSQSDGSKEKKSVAILKEPVVQNFENGRLKWEIAALKAEVFELENKSMLYITKGTLYSDKETPQVEAVILSDNCTLDGSKKISEFENNVQIQFPDGRRLFTGKLFLNHKNKTIYNQHITRIEDRRGEIRASSFFYDINLKRLTFERPKMILELD